MTTTTSHLKHTPGPASTMPVEIAQGAVIFSTAFIFLLIVLHFVDSDLDPNWQPISDYALGDYGWLMVLGFLFMGFGCFSLFAVVRTQTKTLPGMIGIVILLLSAAGFFLAAIFPGDPSISNDAPSVSGQLHSIGAMLGGLIPFALLFLTIALSKNIHWKIVKRSLWFITLLAWIADISFMVAMGIYLPENDGRLGPEAPIGWYNRFMIVTYAVCILSLAAASIRVKSVVA